MGDEIGSEEYVEKNGVKLETVYASDRSEWVSRIRSRESRSAT